METSLIVSTSAPALQAGLDSGGSFGWLRHARTVLASERSTACPGQMPVTSKVARHLRASMVGQLGAGLALLGFRLRIEHAPIVRPDVLVTLASRIADLLKVNDMNLPPTVGDHARFLEVSCPLRNAGAAHAHHLREK